MAYSETGKRICGERHGLFIFLTVLCETYSLRVEKTITLLVTLFFYFCVKYKKIIERRNLNYVIFTFIFRLSPFLSWRKIQMFFCLELSAVLAVDSFLLILSTSTCYYYKILTIISLSIEYI